MEGSGEAAEQVMRMTLNGAEVAIKLSGEGALKLAQIICQTLKQQKRTKGKVRLTSMLRTGKSLKVFTVKEDELKRFTQEAKRYGVMFCVLKNKGNKDGLCDVMVRATDAPKINRIVERFKLATVDSATIKAEVAKTTVPRQDNRDAMKRDPEREKADLLAQEMERKPLQPERNENENPFAAKGKENPSKQSSKKQTTERASYDPERDKPSVRSKIAEKRERRAEAKSAPETAAAKVKTPKTKKVKER